MTPFFIALGVLIAIVLTLRFLRHSNSASGMAKSTARTMLRSLMAIQKEHQYPIDTVKGKRDLYKQVLKMRPGYTDEIIDGLLESAVRLGMVSTPVSKPQGLTFNTVVYLVVRREFEQTWRRASTGTERQQMLTGVDTGLQP